MFDFKRVFGCAVASLSLALALSAVTLGFESSRRVWPVWLLNDWAKIEHLALRDTGANVSGMLKAKPFLDQPLGLLLGTSTTDCGIDPDQLQRDLPPPRRWIRMVGLGTTTCELESMVRLAFDNGLKPEVLALCLDLRTLARSSSFIDPHVPKEPLVQWQDIREALTKRQIRSAFRQMENLFNRLFNDLFADRKVLKARLNLKITNARLLALKALGQNALSAFPPLVPELYAPFAPTFPIRSAALDEARLQYQLVTSSARGHFTPELYSIDQTTYQSLERMIRLGQSSGSEVIVILMPESSEYRDRMPPDAIRYFRQFMRENSAAQRSQMLDFRDALPDDCFLPDRVHATEEGRGVLTRRLIQTLIKHHTASAFLSKTIPNT